MAQQKYETKASRLALAQRMAEESIVLLKNDGMLPLQRGTKVALFGRGQLETQIGGGGSGASFSQEAANILDECGRAGLVAETGIAGFYRDFVAKSAAESGAAAMFGGEMPEDFDIEEHIKHLVASGLMYEIFGKYHGPAKEPAVPRELLSKAAGETDTAICVITRASGGEECDRRVADDYELTADERRMVEDVCGFFEKVAVVLNINGAVDTSWIRDKASVKAVLYMGTPGERGAAALADILVGEVNPSGRMGATFALSYWDYPTAKDFSYNKDEPESILQYRDYGLDAQENGSVGFNVSPVTVYREGMYVGYRYFDTFGKAVMYPFGFGLSYSRFSREVTGTVRKGGVLEMTVAVKNEGGRPGRDVVLIYVSQPSGALEQPYRKLAGFEKTTLLDVGETQTVTAALPLMELASYSQEQAAYVLEAGDYYLSVGSRCDDTHIVGKITVPEEMTVTACANRLSLRECNRGKIAWMSARDVEPFEHYAGERKEREQAACLVALTPEDAASVASTLGRMKNLAEPEAAVGDTEASGNTKTTERTETAQGTETTEEMETSGDGISQAYRDTGVWQLCDVKNGYVSLEDFVAQMTVEELAVLANGFGPGLPWGGAGAEAPCTIQYEDGTDIAACDHPTGNMGYVSPALKKYGIPSMFYKDGPAGVREVAWPTGAVIACSFSKELAYEFGWACGYEADALQDVDSWLAPALNLHRNPIGGRNFEYFSEDPILSGTMGLMIVRGAEENNCVSACPKHFALNEQETYRRGNARNRIDAADSIVCERAARELYLKPFEMIVRESQVKTLMTSFNKINGTFAGGNHDLCTAILRDEWGYEGVVVTDWGDMDTVVDGADAVAAGNDVVMPGGPPVIAQVLQGYREGRCTLEDLRAAACHLMQFVLAVRM